MVNKIDALSDGKFKELVNNCSSTAELLQELGYSIKCNSWGYSIVADRMTKLGLTFGKKFKLNSANTTKVNLNKVLTKDSKYARHKLKERLFTENIKEYKCERCGISEWQGKPISLQLHHLNGINNDNTLSNLQILCPNCHSQTENYGTKGRGRVIRNKVNSLPLGVKKEIMTAVRTLGIVEARKKLPYRNSLINYIVKANNDKIIMATPDNLEFEFSTTYEAAKFLYEKYNIGNSPDSSRVSISKVINGKQNSIKGFKFYRRSAEL